MTNTENLNPDEMKKILKEYRIREKEEKKNQERLDKIHSQEINHQLCRPSYEVS